MGQKRKRAANFLQQKWWRLEIGEWIVLTLCFLGALVIFSILFVRRQTVDYRIEHSFKVSDPEFFASALALDDPVPVPGNRIDLLENGDGTFPPMLEAIKSAKRSINFESYIFASDEVGRQFRDAFCERARAGVEVRILLDGVGSGWALDNSDVRMMKKAGCKFAYYHPTFSFRVDRTNRRTHRRVMVVDGKLGFTGGAAFDKRWAGNAQDPQHWRDLHVRVEGPLVAELQAAFQEHWLKTTREALTGVSQFPPLAPAGDVRGQVVVSHSFSTAPISLLQAVAFAAAERRIWITNPYCTPSKEQVKLLVKAVQRGVDVRLLLPGPHTDAPFAENAGRAAYGKMLEGGVKIFEYQPTMIHEKTMVIDGLFSLVGSSNFDPRSSEINEEIDLALYDEEMARRMEEIFEKNLAQSRQYTLEEFKKRSLWERFTEWLMLPFRSQV